MIAQIERTKFLANACLVEDKEILNHGQKNSWNILTSVEKRDKL